MIIRNFEKVIIYIWSNSVWCRKEGTTAVVSPVKELKYEKDVVLIGDGKIGELTQKLYDTMTGIQWGRIKDTKNWIVPVCQG